MIDGLIARDKHIILCTNALKLDTKVYGVIPPSSRLFLMIHLDGMKETHDFVCNREGVFDKAVEMIKQGKIARPSHLSELHRLQGNRHRRGRRAVQADAISSRPTAS